ELRVVAGDGGSEGAVPARAIGMVAQGDHLGGYAGGAGVLEAGGLAVGDDGDHFIGALLLRRGGEEGGEVRAGAGDQDDDRGAGHRPRGVRGAAGGPLSRRGRGRGPAAAVEPVARRGGGAGRRPDGRSTASSAGTAQWVG